MAFYILYKDIIFAKVAHFSKFHYHTSIYIIFSVALYLTCLYAPQIVITVYNKLGSNEVWGGANDVIHANFFF
jgi:hypothetical protein